MRDVDEDSVDFSRAIEDLPDGMIVCFGPDHVIGAINRAARTFSGNRPGVGLPMREAYPEDATQNLVATFDRVHRSGQPSRGTEWRVLIDQGRGLEERFIDHVTVPLRDDRGRVYGVVAQFDDVTGTVTRRRRLEDRTADLEQRYAAAQDVMLTLQRSLLPAELPVVPGLRLAARYLVAAEEQAAGGDWFDAVALDGRIVAVVGDVVGHGPAAAAVMGRLRAVLAEFLHAGEDLVGALARLDRFAGREPGARGTTACLATVDPTDGAVAYVCAGHPPPLVVSPDGRTRVLPVPGGGPIGVAGPAPVLGFARLEPGEILLCYTDGLVERPDEELPTGIGELAAAASAAVVLGVPSLESDDLVDRVVQLTVDRMTRLGHDDDVTVLALRRTGEQVADLAAEVPARPDQLGVLRERLDAWLGSVGAGRADTVAISLAVLEAVANAIEHAYDGILDGGVRVEGLVDGGGRACLTVLDRGRWRRPAADPGGRGRGIAMMRDCMDSVEIEHGTDGTTVLLDRQLRIAPMLGPQGPAVPGRSGPATPLTVLAGPEGVVRVRGPVDIASVADLRARLWSSSRGGVLPLTIDLSEVTHLASAGIALLYELVEDMGADGHKLAFVAPPGCPAAYALALGGLSELVT